MAQLANFITLLSLLCGFISIILSLESHFTLASWAIILSVILDGLDGQIARKIASPSEFGRQLDSLVDVISFGIAPSVLGYIFVYQSFHLWATVALFVYLFSSVIRLAKYNVTPKEELSNYFYGLPTTMSGAVLSSFILIYRKYTQLPPPKLFLVMVLLLAFLMLSRVKYLNLDGLRQVFIKNKGIPAGIILAITLVVCVFFVITRVFLPELSIFTLFLIYLLFSPFMVKSINSPN